MDLARSIGLAVVESRDASGNPHLENGEQVLQTFDDIQLILASSADQSAGKLFICDGRVIWLSSKVPALGVSVDFASISMHALATDPDSVDKPCLYVQLDYGGTPEASEDEDEEGEPAPFPELRLIPADAASLEPLFQAFCAGAERNPDLDAEEEGQGNLFFDQGEALAGALEVAELGGDFDDLVGEDLERFKDADDEEEEENEEGAADARQNGAS